MEIDPTGDLLEADAYIMVEVSEAAVVRMHASVQRYQDCYCDPNVGLMGYEDLMITLVPDTNNVVVVVVNNRAIEVLQNSYFML